MHCRETIYEDKAKMCSAKKKWPALAKKTNGDQQINYLKYAKKITNIGY